MAGRGFKTPLCIYFLMFDIIPIKKHIKLMAKTEYDWGENKIIVSKVSPALSQQNIFEANLADYFYISKFFF